MSNTVTIGGDRLGAGGKSKVKLRSYERSNHDLSYIWRSTMASGTLVPFMNEVGLPGDTFDIDLDCDIKTHPTIGPLFGSYKVQLDVFSCPIRLYNGKLHMNLLNIGLKMQDIKLPQIILTADGSKTGDNEQINPSSLFSYLNIRGLGRSNNLEGEVTRQFNAVPYLAYWDVYKQYYANRVEELGAYIHNPMEDISNTITEFVFDKDGVLDELTEAPMATDAYVVLGNTTTLRIAFDNANEPDIESIYVRFTPAFGGSDVKITELYYDITWNIVTKELYCQNPINIISFGTSGYVYNGQTIEADTDKPQVTTFPLSNIDDMRIAILQDTAEGEPFYIVAETQAPYGPPIGEGNTGYSKLSTQEGLGLKTYQSDLFNNWINTDWIDGENGVNAITAVDTSGGSFNIDTLILSRKVYDLLNRIAISGGSYDDWLNAVYTHERTRGQENPMYCGGLIKELAFQEVVSNASTDINNKQPLGTLAGRGVLTKKHKGGKIRIKIDEPSYIMGIISLTPRIDYSQGNKWDVNLKTLDDLHKPQLDQISYQDLITDQMAWWDTQIDEDENISFSSAGKQPSWINYMTNVNQTRGNFAVQEGSSAIDGGQMYMTLNRRYERASNGRIADLTTYIDPSKFNNIFADTRIDAQNFWAQIAVNIEARRKMSAKVMPNL